MVDLISYLLINEKGIIQVFSTCGEIMEVRMIMDQKGKAKVHSFLLSHY